MNTKIFFVFLLILVTTFSIHADENYNKALAAYEQKNFDTCLTVLKTVIRENETNYDAHILAAYCHVGRKTYSDAIYHLREVAENSLQHAQTVRTDIVNLYFAMGKYKTARNVGYKYLEAFEDENTKAPLDLKLALAKACLAYGRVNESLKFAREAKQSDNANTKYNALTTEARALITQGNLDEADIALSYAEAMRPSGTLALLRANWAEIKWAQEKFPEAKRADIVANYEKLMRWENTTISAAAQKNMERVKTAQSNP